MNIESIGQPEWIVFVGVASAAVLGLDSRQIFRAIQHKTRRQMTSDFA